MVAFAGYPLILENRLVGVMALFAHHQLTEATLQAMASIANGIALGIDRFWKEEELRKSEERWQLALKGNNDGIWDWNINTDETFRSTRFMELLGYEDHEMGNTNDRWKTRLHPDDFDRVMAANQDYLDRKIPHYAVEHRLRCKNGTYKWVMSRGQALWDEQGKPMRMVGSTRDITQRKIAEEAIRQSEAREREKSKELELTLKELKRTQAQLIQTEKMSSLGRMIAGVSHEINNPVSFIYGNLTPARCYFRDLLSLIELYQQTYPHPTAEIRHLVSEIDLDFVLEDWQQLMDSMQMGAERIQEIMRSLKIFSRLDESEIKPVDIHEAIDNTLVILQHRLRAECDRPEIKVIKDYGQLPQVTCYASQLNQVFMHLLTNAIDALETQPSPRVISICTSVVSSQWSVVSGSEQRTTDMVVIRIADNGSGMSEAIQEKIFDPFFTTKPVRSGTGLGLSTSYQIVVEKHQGKLNCVSALGKGTEFIVEIPVI